MRGLNAFLKDEIPIRGWTIAGLTLGTAGEFTQRGSLARGVVNLLTIAWMVWLLVQGVKAGRRLLRNRRARLWSVDHGCECRMCVDLRKVPVR